MKAGRSLDNRVAAEIDTSRSCVTADPATLGRLAGGLGQLVALCSTVTRAGGSLKLVNLTAKPHDLRAVTKQSAGRRLSES
jgi:hypothetical protein